MNQADEHEDWVMEEDLIPEFLQAWYLLADAGLTASERNMIQTAVGEQYTLTQMSQKLRSQWPEEDRRDQGQMPQKQTGYWREAEPSSGEDEEHDRPASQALMNSGMTEEGIALMSAVQAEEEAMAVIDNAKRTLREARARQHQVKLSRQYYKVNEKTSLGCTGSQTSGIKCFRCGGPHKIAQCPD